MIGFEENVQQDQFFNPQIKFLFTFFILLTPTTCKVLGKTNEQSSGYLKTDRQTNRLIDGQWQLLRTPSGTSGVQNNKSPKSIKPHCLSSIRSDKIYCMCYKFANYLI